MNKLPISVGILSWKSNQVLANTLKSYEKNGLLDMVTDVTIFFQEFNTEDRALAKQFGIKCIGSQANIGIGQAFTQLANNASQPWLMLLEHDFELIESKYITHKRLVQGLELLKSNIDVVRYRHRKKYGEPLFTKNAYKGHELEFWDSRAELNSVHLLDCIHWITKPEQLYKQITKEEGFFKTSSRWANWTNNPVLLQTNFYKDKISQFSGLGIDLEYNIHAWWPKQGFMVAQGEGLFRHNDFKKYPPQSIYRKIMHRLSRIFRLTQ